MPRNSSNRFAGLFDPPANAADFPEAPLSCLVAKDFDLPALSRRSLLAFGAGLVAAPALGQLGSAGSRPVVRTSAGDVAGVFEGGVVAFKGVPYGEPTGGSARFLPASAKKPWSDVFDASRFGPRCPQRGGLGGPDSSGYSEDCLVLNVWTSSLDGAKPVMVWLHGGGWESGGSNDPVSDGAWLAQHQDVVLVSINHRLNVYGHLIERAEVKPDQSRGMIASMGKGSSRESVAAGVPENGAPA